VGTFRALFRSHRGQLLGVLALTAFASLAEAAGLALFSVLINLLMDAKAALPSPGILRSIHTQVRANPRFFFLLLGITYVGKSFLTLAANYASIAVALKIADGWRLRLFAGVLRMPARAVPAKQGALLQLVLDEPSVAGSGLGAGGILIQNVASAATIYATLLWISPAITLGLTVVAAGALVLLAALSRYSHRVAEERSSIYKDGYGYLTEMLGALKQLRIFGLESAVEGQAEHHVARMRTIHRKSMAISSSPRVLIELVFLLAFLVMLAVVTPRMGEAAMVSAAGLAAAAAMRLLPAFSAAAGTWVQVQQALPAMTRIRAELEHLEATIGAQSNGTRVIGSMQRRLEVKGVHFSYADRAPALRGVDLTVEAGTFTAIVGASGSGKSTLFDLLCGLHDPDQGAILVDDVDLREVSKADWRSRLGVVPQDGFLLSGTLRENLCLLRPDCSERMLHEVVAAVGADKIIADLPAGYETVIGERGVALSGGQRQRLALARVLIREPRLLLLDEATSALDPESDEALFHTIEKLRGRMTVVAIAHRLSSVRHADKIFVMQAGVVAESGSHESLLRADGVYAAMCRAAERQTDRGVRALPAPAEKNAQGLPR
jgi:ABC-type multidrug transport system fused ATPase/permease subunit